MAKMEQHGGNPGVIIATPEIDVYQLTPGTDYIMLGSDGIFDHLENQAINTTIQAEAQRCSFTQQATTTPATPAVSKTPSSQSVTTTPVPAPPHQ